MAVKSEESLIEGSLVGRGGGVVGYGFLVVLRAPMRPHACSPSYHFDLRFEVSILPLL